MAVQNEKNHDEFRNISHRPVNKMVSYLINMVEYLKFLCKFEIGRRMISDI